MPPIETSRFATQATFDDLGTPLRTTTFVVVDLETTGGSARTDAITEIGAVKVRGGAVIGEFRTFVSPGRPIPAFISVLTGITDAMLANAPAAPVVLAQFLEFAQGAVLVAHNAPFDIGFLKAGCASAGLPWPHAQVLDTVKLARAILPRGEVRNHKLATLAVRFGATTTPNHRALDDARATVDVLHGLLERVGSLGVDTLEELAGYSKTVPDAVRRKRHLADALPDAPGVYLFKDDAGRVLYVGTSRSLRKRVRSYFTTAETRRRMRDMVRLAAEVVPIVCPTTLEARVRELRLIAEHRPPYNQRSRMPERVAWLRLTDETFPRLSIVRAARGVTSAIGPFSNRRDAEAAAAAIHDAIPLRQCTQRISVRKASPSCMLADLGRCGAPCTGNETPDEYAIHAGSTAHAMARDAGAILEPALMKIDQLAATERFEDAAVQRDRVGAFVRGAATAQRLAALAACPEVVAAVPVGDGSWEVAVIKHGRLVTSAVLEAGRPAMPLVDALRMSAPTVREPLTELAATTPEESLAVLRWLESPTARLAYIDGDWACPIDGAQRHLHRFGAVPRDTRAS